jgi:3-oxoacyl-[acyl-carrier protein] reductase
LPDSAGSSPPSSVRTACGVAWLLSPGDGEHEQRHEQNDATSAPDTGLLARHHPTYDEVANIAAFAASDWARTITASEINFTGGAVID